MTYWVHAFCTDDEVPTLGSVLAWTASQGVVLTSEPASPPFTPQELQSRPWDSLGLWYRPDWSPLTVNIYRAADRSSIFADEVAGFREEITELPESRPRELVLAHLARSRFLVAISLPISALDDDTLWEAVSALLDYFVERSGAMVHIEGDGFYQAGKLILETPPTSSAVPKLPGHAQEAGRAFVVAPAHARPPGRQVVRRPSGRRWMHHRRLTAIEASPAAAVTRRRPSLPAHPHRVRPSCPGPWPRCGTVAATATPGSAASCPAPPPAAHRSGASRSTCSRRRAANASTVRAAS